MISSSAGLAPRLQALDARDLRRDLRPPAGGVCLSGNDYLGLSRDPRIAEALIDALHRGDPHGSTGSRLLTGNAPAWEALEAQFAAWQGAGSALFHATGFAANQGLLGALLEPGDRVISDALNHASLIDGIRLGRAERVIAPHLDLDAYARALRAPGPTGRTWVVVESVYSMDGDLAPLAELAKLCRDHGAHLIVDEAHATGLFGPTGAGRIEATGTRDGVFASVHTCGKALGQSGAFVCGGPDLRDWLVNRARTFVFSTAPPPFLAAGLAAAIGIIQADPALRRRPLALGERLRAALADAPVALGGSASHIVPLIVGAPAAALRLSERLAARGWDARAIRPPTVAESRVRLVLHAGLDAQQIDRLAADVRAILPGGQEPSK